MSRRRHLRPEETDLWHAVARTATPLHPASAPLPVPAKPSVPPQADLVAPAPLPPTFRIGEKAQTMLGHDLVPGLNARQSAPALNMDARTYTRMSRGKLAPEARLDLHGMTLAEAQPELTGFILNAQAQALRLVLVITGKGKLRDDHGPIPQRMGALRHQVPVWLTRAPLAQAVLQVTDAHLRHGGTGALYVYLRRTR